MKLRRCVHVPVSVCTSCTHSAYVEVRGQLWMLVFLFLLRQDLLLLISVCPKLAVVVGSRACRYRCLSCVLRTTGITDMRYGISINTGLRDSNSESQTCTASALPTDLPPNLSKPKLFSVFAITKIKHLFLLTTH